MSPPSRPTGVILVNLGSPTEPSPGAVRRFLAEFLSDPRVVDLPRWFWLPLLYCVILVTRPARVAKAYAKIWTAGGSPLTAISGRIARGVEQILRARHGNAVSVRLAMRYGEPALGRVVQGMLDEGLERLVILPLFPQYSGPTTASVHDALVRALASRRAIPEYAFIDDYATHPDYIAALAESVRRCWAEGGRPQRLMMSFHGLPQRFVDQGDPYARRCEATAQSLAAALELTPEEWLLSYQSRFGTEPWLQPYSDETLRRWGRAGIHQVDVICPGFAADCLETLEEVALGFGEILAEAAHSAPPAAPEAPEHPHVRLRYIPALNDSEAALHALVEVVEARLGAA